MSFWSVICSVAAGAAPFLWHASSLAQSRTGEQPRDIRAQTECVPFAPGEAEGRPVEATEFDGLHQTNKEFVNHEFALPDNDAFEEKKFQRALQRLRNLRLFASIHGESCHTPSGRVLLRIRVAEKVTLLPFFRIKAGGGSTLVVLGVGDLNAFGRGVELLPQYENLDGKYHGGRVEYRQHDVANSSVALEGSAFLQTRHQRVYTPTQQSLGGYLAREKSIKLLSDYEFSSGIITGVGLQISATDLSARPNETPPKDFPALPHHTFYLLGIGRLAFNGINYEDYLLSGTQATITLEKSMPRLGSDDNFLRANASFLIFGRPTSHSNPGARFQLGITNARFINDQFGVGGFSEVRGYLDNQFRGRAYALFNLEWRETLLTHPWLVMQPAFFCDGALVSQSLSLSQMDFGEQPLSLGAGVRIVFPYLARLALRLDYARPLNPQLGKGGFSFGSQQFF